MKWVVRPCQFKRIIREKSEEIKLYLIHKNYALICFVIYNQEIDFQPSAHNPKRVTQEHPFKCVERPCQCKRIFHEKSEEIYLYFIHQNYAPIEFVIYNQEIVFKHFCTHSRTCSIGKSTQMRGTSVSM